MADAAEIHVGNTVELAYQFVDQNGVPISIAAATVAKGWARKPGGVVVEFDLVLGAEATQGIGTYVTDVNFFDKHGTWTTQGKAVIPGSPIDMVYTTIEESFPVRANLV